MKKKTLSDKTFEELGVHKDICKALKADKIEHATKIQAQSIPSALEGKDLIGRSQTGSGKTLAFSIPIVQELHGKTGKGVRALILAPTRELAKQIKEVFEQIGEQTKLKVGVIYGGVAYEPQYEALKECDIIVGTPGRVIDHIKQNHFDTDRIEFFVLDEADRMLDMGFIDDIKYVINKMPPHKQSFFFSATMPGVARDLASSFMHEPVWVKTEDVYIDSSRLDEYYVDVSGPRKADMCREILKREDPERCLIFTNSRLWTDKLAEYLRENGLKAKAIHGAYGQGTREQLVQDFEDGKMRILVATDVAARGLDIDDITHVINFEVARDAQSHTHRVGRTARAGKSGVAMTLLDRDEHRSFSRIEGDSLRDVKKYHIDYQPKKVYFTPRRDDRGKGRRKGGNRKGGQSRKSSNKGSSKKN